MYNRGSEQKQEDCFGKYYINSHNYNKNKFDLHRKELNLNVGDILYVENGNHLNRRKTDEFRIGPYKIMKKETLIYLCYFSFF